MTKNINKKNAVRIAAHLIEAVNEQKKIVLEETNKSGGTYNVIIFQPDLSGKKYQVIRIQDSAFDISKEIKDRYWIENKNVLMAIWQELLSQKYYVSDPKMNSPMDIYFKLKIAKILKGYNFFLEIKNFSLGEGEEICFF